MKQPKTDYTYVASWVVLALLWAAAIVLAFKSFP